MAIPISYSFHNLGARRFTSILTAGGMALVTFVFAAVLMLAEGLERTLIDTGSPDNAIVLRGSAETEVSSVIERASADIIEAQPEVDYNPQGDAIAAKEALVLVTLPKKATGKPTNVTVRGDWAAFKDSATAGPLDCRPLFSPRFERNCCGKKHSRTNYRRIPREIH